MQASFQELVPSLLALAESWARAREATLTAAAAQLYVDLFVGSAGTLERQQVLQALHGHLGSGVAGEQDAALQVGLSMGFDAHNGCSLPAKLVLACHPQTAGTSQ
jgi:hypothetical protein